jgi:hypothetical protein
LFYLYHNLIGRQNARHFYITSLPQVNELAPGSLHNRRGAHTAFIQVHNPAFIAIAQTYPVTIQGMAQMFDE